MVPTAMIIESTPAKDTGTPKGPYIEGQAAPSSESGRPRLMNAR